MQQRAGKEQPDQKGTTPTSKGIVPRLGGLCQVRLKGGIFMAIAKKQKSGKWRVLAYVGKGVTKSGYKSFTADTKKEAERLAAAYLSEAEHMKTGKITVGEAIDKYIESKSNTLSPATIKGYKNIRKSHLEKLMPMRIDRLNKAVIQEEINREAAKNSPKTVRNIWGLLSAVLDFFDAPVYKITLPQKEKKEMKIPSPAELNEILSYFSKRDPKMYLATMLGAFLGLRRSEIAALRRGDYQSGELSISKAMVMDAGKKWIIKQPKTKAGNRKVKVPDVVADVLKKHIEDPDSFLVGLDPERISHRFIRAREKLGLSSFRFHDLRHYYASVMLALGVPDKYVMQQIGHETNDMLKTVYQHTMQDKTDEFFDRLNDYAKNTTQNTTQK